MTGISPILQPPAGSGWFGAYPGGGNAQPGAYEAANMANRTLAVVTRYEAIDGTFPNATDKSAAAAAGYYYYFGWGTRKSAGGYALWQDVTAGVYDAQITAQAHYLADWGAPCFIALTPEMDGLTWQANSGAGHAGADFVPYWKHVWNIVSPIALNVVWCWVVTGGHNNAATAAMYPGDAWVDWIGFDQYDPTLSKGSPSATYTPFMTWLNAQSFGSGKPVGIFETGVEPNNDTGGAAWINKVPAALNSLGIQMWLWFNSSGTWDTIITPGSQMATALANAGASAFFNPVVTATPWTIVQESSALATGTGNVTPSLPGPSTQHKLLIAELTSEEGGGSHPFSGPPGWQFAGGIQQSGVSRSEIWWYPDNPGGISSAAFTSTGTGICKGALTEITPPSGLTAITAETTGAAGATTGATLAVAAAAASSDGDLAVSVFHQHLSAAAAITWADPAGWTPLVINIASSADHMYAACNLNVPAAIPATNSALSVTGASSVSANVTGYTGVLAVFRAFSPVVTAPMTFGAFINPGDAYGGVPDLTAYADYITDLSADGTTRTLPVRRVFMGSFPTSITADMLADVTRGTLVCMSFIPPWSPVSATARTQLNNFLASCFSHGLKAKVSLYPEPINNGITPASAMIAAFRYYADAVTQYYDLVFCVGTSTVYSQNELSYFPGSDIGIKGVASDYYATAHVNGQTLDSAAALADANGLYHSVWEADSSTDPAKGQTQAQATSYWNYFPSFYLARVLSGGACGEVCVFDSGVSGNANTTALVRKTPEDYRWPLIRGAFDILNGLSGSSTGIAAGTAITASHASGTATLPGAGIAGTAAAASHASGTTGTAALRSGSAAVTTPSGGSTTVPFTIPSGAAAGDTICIWVAVGTSAFTWSASGTPAWTAQSAVTLAGGTGSAGTCQLFTRVMDGTEGWTPGTTTVTLTISGGVVKSWAGLIFAIPGAYTADPAISSSGQVNSPSAVLAVAGVTEAAAGDLLAWLGFSDGAGAGAAPGAIAVPSGYAAGPAAATPSGTAINVNVALATRTQPTSGATGDQNGSIPVAHANGGLLLSFSLAVTWAGAGTAATASSASGSPGQVTTGLAGTSDTTGLLAAAGTPFQMMTGMAGTAPWAVSTGDGSLGSYAPSLIPAADSDFESAVTGHWISWANVSSLTQSAAQAYTGTHSLALVIPAAGLAQWIYNPTVLPQALDGASYLFTIALYAPSADPLFHITYWWYDAAMDPAIGASSYGFPVLPGWQLITAVLTPPFASAFVQAWFTYTPSAAGTAYVDNFLWQIAGFSLAGTAASPSGATGLAGQARIAAGTAAAISAGSGTAVLAMSLAGGASAASIAGGTVSQIITGTSAAAAAVSAAVGTLTAMLTATGTTAAASSASALAGRVISGTAGAAATASLATGTVSAAAAVTGLAAVLSTGTGTITGLNASIATATGTSAASVTVTAALAAAGTSAAVTLASGSLSDIGPAGTIWAAAGTAAAISAAAGTLTMTGVLVSAVTAVSAASGLAGRVVTGSAGTGSALSAAAGALTGLLAIAGAAVQASLAVGGLTGTGALAGTAALLSTAAGLAGRVVTGAAGTAAGLSVTGVAVTGLLALSAAASAVSLALAVVTATVAAAGLAAGLSSAAGAIGQVIFRTGSDVAMLSAASGTITGADIAGTAATASLAAGAGVLVPIGPAPGALTAVFTAVSPLARVAE